MANQARQAERRKFRTGLIARHKQSGKTVEAFCQENGVGGPSFYAAGAAGLRACTMVNTLTSNDAEIIPSQRRERSILNGLSAAQESPGSRRGLCSVRE